MHKRNVKRSKKDTGEDQTRLAENVMKTTQKRVFFLVIGSPFII